MPRVKERWVEMESAEFNTRRRYGESDHATSCDHDIQDHLKKRPLE